MPITIATAVGATAGTSNVSLTINVDSATQVLVTWLGTIGSTANASTLTVNSSAATNLAPLTAWNNAPQLTVGYWHPQATGSINVTGVHGGSVNKALGAVVLDGVSTATPFGTTAASSGASTTPSHTFAATAGGLSLSFVSYESSLLASAADLTTGAGVTEFFAALVSTGAGTNSMLSAGGYAASSSPASTLSWVAVGNAANEWALFGLTVNPAVANARGHNVWMFA